jgi:Cu/Ag efflux pump CusA
VSAAADFRVATYVIGAAILIFFLLQAGIGSWRLAGVYSVLLVAALAGGVLAAVIGRSSMSVAALLGLLTVLAVAVRGGIVQIKQYQRLEQEGLPAGPELVVVGSRQRFAPAVTGLLAAGVALLPLVVLGVTGGLEIVTPLAWIILGGLLTTGIVNMLLLPALYLPLAATAVPAVAAGQDAGRPRDIADETKR